MSTCQDLDNCVKWIRADLISKIGAGRRIAGLNQGVRINKLFGDGEKSPNECGGERAKACFDPEIYESDSFCDRLNLNEN
jgi:hypothetical protein